MITSAARIHLIDDDPHSVMLLEHILQKKGFEVRSSLSGKAALEEFKQYTPDLILLDIVMPEMDGYGVCHALKKSPELKTIPVIFITASPETSELVKGFEAGAVDFISKPINKPEILARVTTHLELKLSRDLVANTNRELMKEIEYRKQAEEKFRALSETAFESVLFLKDEKIVEANCAARLLFGLNGDQEGWPDIANFVDEKEKKRLRKIFGSLEAGPWEMNFVSGNGKPFYAQVQHQSIPYKGEMINVLAIRDVTRQKEHDKEVLNAIVETQEKERKRFSRDLHDGLGALLSTLKIYTGLLQKENKSEEEKYALLEEVKEIVGQAVESARTIANNIMPSLLMDHGLLKALVAFTDALNKTGYIKVEFSYPKGMERLNESAETHLYRIALELINNSLKHSGADTIWLNMRQSGRQLIFEYSDNGSGFDFERIYKQKEGGQGLKNLFSRANFLNGKASYQKQNDGKLLFYMEIPI